MMCPILLAPNIVPTNEQLQLIHECFIAEIQPYRILLIQRNNDLIPNISIIAQIENHIDFIKNQYVEKYFPYFN